MCDGFADFRVGECCLRLGIVGVVRAVGSRSRWEAVEAFHDGRGHREEDHVESIQLADTQIRGVKKNIVSKNEARDDVAGIPSWCLFPRSVRNYSTFSPGTSTARCSSSQWESSPPRQVGRIGTRIETVFSESNQR